MKISLSELSKLLFPEIYPFHEGSIRKEMAIISANRIEDKNMLNAIAFKAKVAKISLKIKPEIRDSIYYIFDKFTSRVYDWDRQYEWHELKLILNFFVLVWDVKTIGKLENRVKNPVTIAILKKYKPEFPETK